MNRFCKEIFVYTYILHSKYGKPTKQILIIKNHELGSMLSGWYAECKVYWVCQVCQVFIL